MDRAYLQQVSYTVNTAANIASVKPLCIANFRSGSVGGATGGTLTFYGSDEENGTYRLIEGSDSTDLSLTMTNNRWSQLPAAVFDGPKYLKIIHGASQQSVVVALKS